MVSIALLRTSNDEIAGTDIISLWLLVLRVVKYGDILYAIDRRKEVTLD